VVVDGLVVGVDDPVQVREVPIQVDVVCIGTAGQKVLASLKVEFSFKFNKYFFTDVKVR